MKKVEYHPNAKINLGLFIKGRGPDGFHLLETLYLPVLDEAAPRDLLLVEEVTIPGISLEMEGLNEDLPKEKNLVWKAWKIFSEAFPESPGVKVKLVKNIPAGAGVGGGSSDAASMLLAMNEISGYPFTKLQLAVLARPIGSDIPFFIYNRPMIGTGTGTELTPFEMDFPWKIKLVFPGIHSSTPEAYNGLDISAIDTSRSLIEILKLPVNEWQSKLVNDLEVPVFKKYPVLVDIKQKLIDEGAVYAGMSGSGSAIFGLVE